MFRGVSKRCVFSGSVLRGRRSIQRRCTQRGCIKRGCIKTWCGTGKYTVRAAVDDIIRGVCPFPCGGSAYEAKHRDIAEFSQPREVKIIGTTTISSTHDKHAGSVSIAAAASDTVRVEVTVSSKIIEVFMYADVGGVSSTELSTSVSKEARVTYKFV